MTIWSLFGMYFPSFKYSTIWTTLYKLKNYKPSRKELVGSMVAQSCAAIKGVEQIIYITMTAMVCFTVFILALEMRGILSRFVLNLFILRGRKLESEHLQISRQIQLYVYTNTSSGIMKTVTQYLGKKIFF